MQDITDRCHSIGKNNRKETMYSKVVKFRGFDSRNSRFLGFAILFLLMLSPVLIWPLYSNSIELRDPLYTFNLLLSIIWAALIVLTLRRKYRYILIIPISAVVAFDLFLLIGFDSRLTSSYINIAITDYSDTYDFIKSYYTLLLPIICCTMFMGLLGVHLTGDILLTRKFYIRSYIVFSILVIYFAYFGYSIYRGSTLYEALQDLAQKENSSPAGTLWQLGLAVKTQTESNNLAKNRIQKTLGVQVLSQSVLPEVVVIVIGESSRPQNWSIYGYERDTNPLLSNKRKELIVLRDAYTTAPHTAIAVPSMLSLQSIENWKGIQENPSIITAFNKAEFKSYWVSTQATDGWAGTIPMVAQEANKRQYFEHNFDHIVLDYLRKVLLEPNKSGRKIFIAHTRGSHFEYKRRYPSNFSKFDPSSPSKKERLVAEYDNTILYTDWLLFEIILTLERTGQRAILAYFSDHGQNIYDDDRGFFGHAIGTYYDLRIPGFFWVSKSMKDVLGDKISILENNASKKFSISNFPHTLLDMSGIHVEGMKAYRSLARLEYDPPPLKFMVRGKIVSEESANIMHQR